jgi:hypothetical protein
MDYLFHAAVIGIGATALMDLWTVLRQRLFGIPRLDYALLGRWVAHLAAGRVRHGAIAVAAPVRAERPIGWSMHYLIGMAFAALLLGVWGLDWVHRPTLAPALIVGVGTVAAPLLILQPAMGGGLAASRTARPASVRLQSVITHTIYGLGLFLAGWADHCLFTP